MLNLKRLVLSFIVLGFTSSAFATMENEIFWQAKSGENFFTPSFEYNSQSLEFEGGTKSDLSLPTTGLQYEYGFNEMLSFGAELAYTFGTTEVEAGGNTTESDTDGLEDIEIFAKGQMELDSNSSFHFGAALGLGLGDSETDEDGNDNRSSGRIGLTPYVGYVRNMGPGWIGARLSYQFFLTEESEVDKSQTPDQESSFSNGETLFLTAFYEMPMAWGLLGFNVQYQARSERKLTELNGAEQNDVSQNDDFNAIAFTVYPRYKINDMITLVGEATYGFLTNDELSGTNLDSSAIFSISAGARIQI